MKSPTTPPAYTRVLEALRGGDPDVIDMMKNSSKLTRSVVLGILRVMESVDKAPILATHLAKFLKKRGLSQMDLALKARSELREISLRIQEDFQTFFGVRHLSEVTPEQWRGFLGCSCIKDFHEKVILSAVIFPKAREALESYISESGPLYEMRVDSHDPRRIEVRLSVVSSGAKIKMQLSQEVLLLIRAFICTPDMRKCVTLITPASLAKHL